ncbi:MAG: DUF1326 domain-containing protein [Planctomycetes bacterium]|nr:DUF1326 domain-containing protein [Planctomycetota bacterium]
MRRWILCGIAAYGLGLIPATTITASNKVADIQARGMYVEARTCDVWTGPCFANADFNLGGKQGVMAWRIDKGEAGEVSLDGLCVVAVVSAANTLGLEQRAPAKAVILVDSRANLTQRAALVRFAQQQGGQLLANVVKIDAQPIKIDICPCQKNACAEVDATVAKLKTRCLSVEHDKVCGNEYAFYPPLARNLKAIPAGVLEHAFRGKGLGETWSDSDRRAGYVGTFLVK